MGPESAAQFNPIPLMLIMLIFYFIVWKPQQKQKKEAEEVKNNIKKNDQIITSGGIHGTVVNVKEKTIILRIDDNVKIELDKEAISTIVKVKS